MMLRFVLAYDAMIFVLTVDAIIIFVYLVI